MSVTAGGYGSREKARIAMKKAKRVPKVTAEPMDVVENNTDSVHNAILDAQPLAMVVEPLQPEDSPDKSVARLVWQMCFQCCFIFTLQITCMIHYPSISVDIFTMIC